MKIIEGYESIKPVLSRQASEQEIGTGEKEQWVRQAIAAVRSRGDAVLLEYTEKLDGVRLTSLEVDKREIEQASREVNPRLLTALKLAAERIEAYHVTQKESLLRDFTDGGLGWLLRPMKSVGVHAPGFTAPLPSSLLMTAIPAKVAGVKSIILVTPPGKQGAVSSITLAAAGLAGVDRVFSIGGAQAIAALAYGTETVPRVDKVCGPGNIYVSLAKKLVYGDVGIDGLYGPSEVIIIADETADVEYCAADLLAQAEHPDASAILLTTSKKVADEVNAEVLRQLTTFSKQDVVTKSLESKGFIGIVATMDEAIELANLFAPEHLCLLTENAEKYVDKVENAGCLFVGENAIEVLVDYVAGPSHVLPTDGSARFSSQLNVTDFVKYMSVIRTDRTDMEKLGKTASVIARAEGLEAHARAAERRLERKKKG